MTVADGEEEIPAEVSEPEAAPAAEVPRTPSGYKKRANKEVNRTPPQPSKLSDVPSQTKRGANYALMFTLYVNGMELKQIAEEFNVGYMSLYTRASVEKWSHLVEKAWDRLYKKNRVQDLDRKRLEDRADEKLKSIGRNRSEVIDLAGMIRNKIVALSQAFDQINPNELRDPEVFSNLTKSIGSLAKAAKDVADMTMVAHGDEHVIRHLGAGFNKPGGGNEGPQIVINMPGVLATSRRRAALPAGQQIEPVALELAKAGDAINQVLNNANGSATTTP